MALSREDVAGIADYARIDLTERELDEMTAYMNEAVGFSRPSASTTSKGSNPPSTHRRPLQRDGEDVVTTP